MNIALNEINSWSPRKFINKQIRNLNTELKGKVFFTLLLNLILFYYELSWLFCYGKLSLWLKSPAN